MDRRAVLVRDLSVAVASASALALMLEDEHDGPDADELVASCSALLRLSRIRLDVLRDFLASSEMDATSAWARAAQ